MTILDDTTIRHEQTVNDILHFLNENGVPDERIQGIKERIKVEEQPIKSNVGEPYTFVTSTISAFLSIQSYARCFPYLDSNKLISKCADAWEALSARSHAEKQTVNRKLMAMRMDPKADPASLEHLESLKSDYEKACTAVNINLYRIRVLQTLHEKKTKK